MREPHVCCHTVACFTRRLILLHIHVFVCDCSPKPFCEESIERSPSSIHAHTHAMLFEKVHVWSAGKRASLISGANSRPGPGQCLLERLQSDAHLHRLITFPGEHRASRPIQNHHKGEAPLPQPKRRAIQPPDVVRRTGHHNVQHRRRDRRLVSTFREMWARRNHCQSHLTHCVASVSSDASIRQTDGPQKADPSNASTPSPQLRAGLAERTHWCGCVQALWFADATTAPRWDAQPAAHLHRSSRRWPPFFQPGQLRAQLPDLGRALLSFLFPRSLFGCLVIACSWQSLQRVISPSGHHVHMRPVSRGDW